MSVTLTQASQRDANGAEVGESTEGKRGDALSSLLEGTAAGDSHVCPGAAPELSSTLELPDRHDREKSPTPIPSLSAVFGSKDEGSS